MKSKNKQIFLVAAGHETYAFARVSTVLGICLLGLGLAWQSRAGIILPDCGPLFEVYSVTVRAARAVEADALSTGLLVMGRRKGQRLVEKDSAWGALWIYPENQGVKIEVSERMEFVTP